MKAIINDYEPVNLLIDTGASMTVITPELAYSLGLFEQDLEDIASFQTANGETSAPVVVVGKLQIGHYTVNNLHVGVLPLASGGQLQGLLGMDFLQRFKFFIDQRKLTLELLAWHE